MKMDDEECILVDSCKDHSVGQVTTSVKKKGSGKKIGFVLGLFTGLFLSLFIVRPVFFRFLFRPTGSILVINDGESGLPQQDVQVIFQGGVAGPEMHERWPKTENEIGLSHMETKHTIERQERRPNDNMSCSITETDRFDCWPESQILITKIACLSRGCCYRESKTNGAPYCFYPTNYITYASTSSSSSSSGMSASLAMERASPYPSNAKQLQVDVTYMSDRLLRFKIFDANNSRFEVPMNLSIPKSGVKQPDYEVTFQERPFGILITRRDTGVILFDSRKLAPLMFADQYLQIATRLSTPNVYGLGEHQASLKLDVNWNKLVLWTRDQQPDNGGNLYGAHPFYLNLEPDGNAHGLFLLSSTAVEVALQPYAGGEGALTYRALGGILDFYLFTGPTALNVVEQYVSLVGKPAMPPFWSLGFHLCKYGYDSTKHLQEVIDRNRAIKIPYDVQWSDIDYMEHYKDWTYNSNGSYKGLDKLVDNLHINNQRYVMIIDPGISSTQKPGTYPAYDDGVEMDLFMKNASGQILIGKVWPGPTAFPDFFHPKADEYWYKQMKSYYNLIKYDGIWLDMNEISNQIDGSEQGCTLGPLDNPPYLPPGIDGHSLYSKNVCPSAKQYLSTNYNLHNMYGWSEMRSTRNGLVKLLGKRSFVLSRSTFSGSGKYGAHWTGDNNSRWPDLYYSIPGILKLNIFGVVSVGADVCGVGADTTQELCIRWMQLGSFYPFMRNHNGHKPQDPASFDKNAVDSMRTALETRYSLLPFMYTCFFNSHVSGTPVVRPLFMLFPNTETIDRQFMWGDSLLISPVLEEGAVTVDAYFPEGLWYNLYNGSLTPTVAGESLVLDSPLSVINVHVRGGSIIPRLPPALTTNEMRTKPFFLQVAPDKESKASGMLFWDDGESLDILESKNYSLVNFTLVGNSLFNEVLVGNYPQMKMDQVQVFGVASLPKSVMLNGKIPLDFSYNDVTKVLCITSLNVDLLTKFVINWS